MNIEKSTLRAVLTNICLLSISLAVTLVAVEAVFRLTVLRHPPKRWSDRSKFYVRPYGSRNMQGERFADPKPEGTFRISVVGDSISFGPYLQIDDTFSERLQRLLNTNNPGARAEVINFGVPGFSTADEVPVAQRALDAGSDLLILQVSLNDPELESLHDDKVNRFGPYRPGPFMEKVFSYWKSARYAIERIHNTNTRAAYVQYFFDLFKKDATWGNFTRSADKIIAMARAKQVPIIVVVFPVFGDSMERAKYSLFPLHEQLQEFFKGRGVQELDLFNYYENIPVERLQVIPGPGGDIHPNEIAHRIAAERIYLYLHKNGLIPDDLKVKRYYPQRRNNNEKGRRISDSRGPAAGKS